MKVKSVLVFAFAGLILMAGPVFASRDFTIHAFKGVILKEPIKTSRRSLCNYKFLDDKTVNINCEDNSAITFENSDGQKIYATHFWFMDNPNPNYFNGTVYSSFGKKIATYYVSQDGNVNGLSRQQAIDSGSDFIVSRQRKTNKIGFYLNNDSQNDIKLIETYISGSTKKIEKVESRCIAPSSMQKRLDFNNLVDLNNNKIIAAELYQYDSNNGKCEIPESSRFWPTYYQPEPVVAFNAIDISNNFQKYSHIQYTVLQNSQDTQAQKGSPVNVINQGDDNQKLVSVATYADAGPLYYVPAINSNGVLIGSSIKINDVGTKFNPFNQYVYINNSAIDSQNPSYITIR
ncbi:hypothetical protein OAO18_03850 [Francisellaceae bacterium]|nr:hypothetical protein [Francisellaceae bacterium]